MRYRPLELDIDLECLLCQNRPCKIVEMSTSKTGKHGHAKVHLVALDIFTGGNEIQPLTGIFYFRQEAGGHLPLHSQHGGIDLDLLSILLYLQIVIFRKVPNVKRKDYQLIGVNDDFLSLMDDTGDMR